MTSYKLLIDTNIFIGLEDARLVNSGFSDFSRGCQEHSASIFVHEASIADISRDKDEGRREISLSKIEKFQKLSGIKLPTREELEREFGSISKPNDEVDVSLLFALRLGAVDFLITQDQGIHDRVKQTSLSKRVMRLSDALTWLQQTFEPTKVQLPLVGEKKAHQIDRNDEIFVSLRQGYPEFDSWWERCIQAHRLCWTIELDNELAGICVRKQESAAEAKITSPGDKILKICTFKVKPKFTGEKLGELLLKQALWFAQKNYFDAIYLTTQPEQELLIRVLEYFGFVHTQTRDKNERVYEKQMSSGPLLANGHQDIFVADRLNYPRFISDGPVTGYCVPIRGEYHRKLFPEIALREPLPLFAEELTFDSGIGSARTPGNTIRKAYICKSPVKRMNAGDLLFFYESTAKGFLASQSITSVGVLETLNITEDIEELVRLTAKRSVYSAEELRDIISVPGPVKVLDFLLVGHYDTPVPLQTLKELEILKGVPQSITKLDKGKVDILKARLNLGFVA